MKDEFDFLPVDRHQRFLQIDWLLHGQITQNNRFAVFLEYLKKEVSDKVDLLHEDKHEILLQIDIMIFNGDGQTLAKFSE